MIIIVVVVVISTDINVVTSMEKSSKKCRILINRNWDGSKKYIMFASFFSQIEGSVKCRN